jgi:CDP-diacylglycerol--glycerol-3-phosphate 3-phosphatidyltransferase
MRIRISKELIPWAMAGGRAMLGPVLIVGERYGWNGLALAWLVVSALVSDIFDGVLARRWRCDTAGVRLFDSMADTVFYGCVAVALWIGLPQVWHGNGGLLVAVLLAEVANFGVALAKFGKPASYHSYVAKVWGLVLATVVIAAFASGQSNMLIPVALGLGVASNLEGIAMSLMLPVWRKDVKTLRAAWRLRQELGGGLGMATAIKLAMAATLALCLLTAPAFAMEPGQAAFAGGTAGIAQDTPGTLDTRSATELVFHYKASGGTGEIAIPYARIRTFEARNDVVRHLGFLPALGAGLVAARQRRYTLAISYADTSDAMQVAILQVAERDQHALEAILRARAPKSCMVTQYSNYCPVARPVPAATEMVAPVSTPATAIVAPLAMPAMAVAPVTTVLAAPTVK